MSRRPFKLVVIGGSAGSLDALSHILPALPADFALPILVVVHLPPDRDSVLAEVLQNKCAMKVREAEDKEPTKPHTVYLAPPDYHLLVESDRSLSLSSDEPQMYSRPSIDVLFESAADAVGAGVIGIVLSGANSDGTLGLQAILREGGIGLVQSPAEAFASEMPRAAAKACPDAMTLSAEQISQFLKKSC
ncbi:chemotaxis protein CheB [soil metagenome]